MPESVNDESNTAAMQHAAEIIQQASSSQAEADAARAAIQKAAYEANPDKIEFPAEFKPVTPENLDSENN